MTDDEKTTLQRFTHALLSPLTVVLGTIEMLQNQADDWPEYCQEMLQLALAQGQRLQTTLTSLIASAQVNGSTVCLFWVNPAALQTNGQSAQPPDNASSKPEAK